MNRIARWEGSMEIRTEKKGQEKKNQRSATKKRRLWYYVGYLSARDRMKTEHPSYRQNS